MPERNNVIIIGNWAGGGKSVREMRDLGFVVQDPQAE